MAGIRGALAGSLWTLLVTLIVSFPLGVLAAIYLEEIAPKNRYTALIEVNINNLAAVPSIVYGLLGLAVFINFLHLPRSAPLVGGLVLALMTLPRIIIPTRAAFASIPPRFARQLWGWRVAHASHYASRLAAGHAGDFDRHDYRSGAGGRRNRAAFDDWHDGLYS